MKPSDVLTKERIIINISGEGKTDVLGKMVQVAGTSGKVTSETDLLRKVMEREKIRSTGIGGGVGIPHAQTSCVTDIVGCLAISQPGVEFNAIDMQPVHVIFLIATKERFDNKYLALLSRVARLFVNESFKQKIMKSTSSEEIMNLIIENEKE
ncbi:MAG: PTS sugar transporter subunit IIA [Candidatus Brocadia sp.]|nr:PTS sugar transporter subunit IIA [Candidatus Brocadia sp.]UJS21872.1 MAG: PTS sugar transporter subunit IIA [Candidatus Brocadia sp.]